MRRVAFAATVVICFVLPGVGSSLAMSQRDVQDCDSSDTGRKILGCSAIINDGRLPATRRASALVQRGFAYLDKEDYQSAIADFNEAVRLDPKNQHSPLWLTLRGLAYEGKGDVERAKADLQAALALPSTDPFNMQDFARRRLMGLVKREAETITKRFNDFYEAGNYAAALAEAQKLEGSVRAAFGTTDPYYAFALDALGRLHKRLGHYAEAESLYRQALLINERAFGADHPNVGAMVDALGNIYATLGRYVDAEPLYRRSLAILEKALGPDHPHVAAALNNMAGLYRDQGRYADAEPLFRRSLAIGEKAFGPDHRNVAAALNNLAILYVDQSRYAEAEPLYQRALAIREKELGPDHPDVAATLNNLAILYVDQSRYAEAEPL
jgi:tetratricopeptide (TPR) repeat protein